MYVCIYIYIYTTIHISLSLSLYIYIYTHVWVFASNTDGFARGIPKKAAARLLQASRNEGLMRNKLQKGRAMSPLNPWRCAEDSTKHPQQGCGNVVGTRVPSCKASFEQHEVRKAVSSQSRWFSWGTPRITTAAMLLQTCLEGEVYINITLYVCMYIYIYRERERDGERETERYY